MKEIWIIWFVIAAAFMIGEIFTAGFFLLWFGVGAAVAGILALAGISAVWQWVAFVVVTGVLVAISRQFAEKFSKKQPSGVGADRFVGKSGIVIEEIDNMKNVGRVRVEREEWIADSENDEIIAVGQKIEVIGIDGTHLIIKPIKGEEK